MVDNAEVTERSKAGSFKTLKWRIIISRIYPEDLDRDKGLYV